MDQSIDIVEQRIQELDPELLAILLRDETTGQNIRWACEDYASLSELGLVYRKIGHEHRSHRSRHTAEGDNAGYNRKNPAANEEDL